MTEGESDTTLEYTPTWVVASVCIVIVAISLAVERIIHFIGKYLKKKNQKPLFEALLKVKEELMLLGFISLLLTVLQERIGKICISKDLARHMLPCKLHEMSSTEHYQSISTPFISGIGRRLLTSGAGSGYCLKKIRKWKRWEESIEEDTYNTEEGMMTKFTVVHEHSFIKSRFQGIGKDSTILRWLHSFFKQFYGSVSQSDYITLRLGFIDTHCRKNPKFNFHKYLIRCLEVDFKKVVGIRWYLWLFVFIFLLLNVHGWNTYFWLAFIPFILLLVVGTKLEYVITQLAHKVAEKHYAIEGDLVVTPSDDLFWFRKPKIVLLLIHLILFQNSFEIALFFWIWGFRSGTVQLQHTTTLCHCHTDGKSLQNGYI